MFVCPERTVYQEKNELFFMDEMMKRNADACHFLYRIQLDYI